MAEIGQFPSLGIYDKGGKFEVKQENINAAKAKAIEEGKKYYGDATNFEIFRDSVLNLPDSVINFIARGTEGTGELVAGIASAAMKGGQLATTADPDKLTQIMSEPSFTKYMGAFRDKIPTPNLYKSNISGMEDVEKAFGTAGYYTAPVPVVPIAKVAGQVGKGIASTRAGQQIAKTLGDVVDEAKYVPEMIRGEAAFPWQTQPKPVSLSAAAVKSEDDILKDYTKIKYPSTKDTKKVQELIGRDKGNFWREDLIKLYEIRTGKQWQPRNPDYIKSKGKIDNFYSPKTGDIKASESSKQLGTTNVFLSKLDEIIKNDPAGADFSGTYDNVIRGTKLDPKGLKSTKNRFWNKQYENAKKSGMMTDDQIKYMDEAIDNMGEVEAYTRNLEKVPIFNPKGTIAEIKSSQIPTQAFRKGTDKVIQKLVNQELGDYGKGLQQSIKKMGTNLFQWDHIKPFMFGGKNSMDNLTPIHIRPHEGKLIEGKFLNVDQIMRMKTGFERGIFSKYKWIINLVNKGGEKNIAKAEKLSNDVRQTINTAIENKVPYKFSIDEPHGAFKIGEKQTELKSLIDVYSKDPDKVRSLIHKVDYTPDFLKTNINDPEIRIVKELEGVYNRVAGLKVLGLPKEIIKEGVPGLSQGGMININQLTRPL